MAETDNLSVGGGLTNKQDLKSSGVKASKNSGRVRFAPSDHLTESGDAFKMLMAVRSQEVALSFMHL